MFSWLQVLFHHLAPVSGSVRFAGPDVKAVWHTFFDKRLAQYPVAFVERIVFADCKRDVHTAQRVEKTRVLQVGQKMVRSNEIDLLIVVSAEQIFERSERTGEVVSPTKRDDFAEERWMPECEARRMIGADTASVYYERWDTVFR
jgi:hypothetical protein